MNFQEEIYLFVEDGLDTQHLSLITALSLHIYFHYFCTTVFTLHSKIIYALIWNKPESSAYNHTFLFLEHVTSSYSIANFLLLCL